MLNIFRILAAPKPAGNGSSIEPSRLLDLLKMVHKHARFGFWTMIPETGRIEWDRTMLDIYGVSSSEFDHHISTWEKAVYPGDLETAKSALNAFLQGGDASPAIFRIVRPDGEMRWVQGWAAATFDDKGKISNVLGLNRDITEEVNRSQYSEKRFRDFANATSDWFWETDEHLRFTYISEHIFNIIGIGAAAHIGKSLTETAQPDHHSGHWINHIHGLEKRLPFKDFEYARKNSDGKTAYLLISGVPYFDGKGRFLGYRGTGSDVTGRRELEKKLRQSQRMEAVGQLTGGIAHDFNNVLSLLMGYAELIDLDLPEDCEARAYAKRMIATINRGASLTNRLLAFSRQQALSPKPTDVGELIAGLEEVLQRTLGETICLQVSISPGLWPVLVDPHQLENAVVNLAINARDAIEGGGRLDIHAENTELPRKETLHLGDVDPGKYVKVTVTDSGTGMAPEVQVKAIEPFFTTKKAGQGSGLGLSMVYGFIKQSGGHFSISSREGEGTSVSVFLPRSTEPVTTCAEVTTATGFAKRSAHVLVVEDDQDVRSVPAKILRDQGYEVREAADGPSALEVLQGQDRLDLLFSDIILPGGMTGMDIADRAKQFHPDIKIILTTGYAKLGESDIETLSNEARVIAKPYRRAELLSLIESVLSPNGA